MNRIPEKCIWGYKFDGVYICRGMCAPCERVDPKWCDMERVNSPLAFMQEAMKKMEGE